MRINFKDWDRSMRPLTAGCWGIVLVSLLVISASADAATTYLNFGGSRPGGGAFYMAGGISPILTREIKDLNVVGEATQGDIENVRRTGAGSLDLGIMHGPTMAQARKGMGIFKGKKPAKNLQVLIKLFDSPFTLLALKSSGITKYGDLAGKIISGGPAGSGSIKNFRFALKAFGLLDKVKIKYLTYADQTSAMIEKRVDAAGMNGGGVSWQLALEAQRPVRLIPMSQSQAKLFLKTFPGYWMGDYNPSKFFKTLKTPVLTIWDTVFLGVNAKTVSNRNAYEMVKVIFRPEVLKKLPKIHKLLKGVGNGVKEARGSGLPVHEGALRYWKEKGIVK